MLRQGDVLIKPVEGAPEGLKQVPRDGGRLVLAYGEVTGHAHVVEGEAELFTPEDRQDLEARFLLVEEESTVVHDEHDALTLAPGWHEVRQQREYAPEAPRVVAD